MTNIENAIKRIERLECPTGELEYRVAEVLEAYNVASRDHITIKKQENEEEGNEVYKVNIQNNNRSMMVQATSGQDDYVTKVINVY
ncbi:hypothetical protein RH915_05555 [Serpentinicella sp. ANB-PHB4]|uniref:hypothetical protein n=1 Tax=Serpentinicella sp. ANB-PHB4 TaxID=3074076 RepID=UPI00285A66BE|nr:hypothetical protein [Serpentinicella sp. ANB-PHB4]MDR5658948.1 hypothetical protein [Serpentinicella sp. ANB-PHB4]